MAGSRISNLVTISVTLGSAAYPSPLTITPTGFIDPSAGGGTGATGLVATISAGYVLNQGTVAGGDAATGGIGIDIAGGSLTNRGNIAGGSAAASGGVAGLGADVTDSSLTNDGTITGGYGVSYIVSFGGPGGAGGSGVDLTSSSLTNAGLIAGGYGGQGYEFSGAAGGSGGTGIDATNSSLTNDGTIAGGSGGDGAAITGGGTPNAGGAGGTGVSLGAGSSLTNKGAIAGGYGGNTFNGPGIGGAGGTGVDATGSSLINDATIAGGSGGFVFVDGGFNGSAGGAGGAGVSLAAGSTLTNDGAISGGVGGSLIEGFYGSGGAGASGVDVASSSLTNNGTIAGGSGGYGGGVQTYATGGSGGSGANVTSGSLTNNGTITGGNGAEGGIGGGSGGAGVSLAAGSSLTNIGMINGGAASFAPGMEGLFYSYGASGVAATDSSLTNDGTIAGGSGGFGGDGVDATNSTVTNNGTIISGYSVGVQLDGGFTGVALTSGILTNNGRIAGDYYGVYVSAGGVVTNTASGVIAGYKGLFVSGAATVINAGTIVAEKYGVPLITAVQFSGPGADLLIDDPGAVFDGNVAAQGSPATLELASAAATGSITGIGTSFTGFGTIAVDPGATWVATGSVTGSATISLGGGSGMTFGGSVAATSPLHFTANTGTLGLGDPAGFAATVFGLQPGDAIDFTSITSTASITAGVNGFNDLALTSNGTLLTEIKLDPAQNFSRDAFHAAPDGGTGTVVTETPLCFLAGTMIGTPSGEVPIEQLCVGDMVLTARGEARPIVWIGTGQALATRNRRSAATPVIVRKGALEANVPHHDLRVTKAHALSFDGVLIPVEFLVNHRSILWDDMAQEVVLYHIELETHDVLLANGAPAESYRDDGNRWLFRNANRGWHLPPRQPCAPVLTGGDLVDAVWSRLLQRVGPRPGVPLTNDPDLHLLIDGGRIDAVSSTEAFQVFRLARTPDLARIVSRAAAPQELGVARDPRTLGVALGKIVVRQGARSRVLKADDPALAHGFHAFEAANGFRWTNGDAVLPAPLFAGLRGPLEVVLQCVAAARYVDDGAKRRAA